MATGKKTDIARPTTASRSSNDNSEAAAFWGALGGALLGEVLRTPSPRPTYREVVREVPVYREVVVERTVVIREEPTLRGSMEAGRRAVETISNAGSYRALSQAEMEVRLGAAFNCSQVANILRRVSSFVQLDVAKILLPNVYDRYNWSIVVESGSSFNRYALMAMV